MGNKTKVRSAAYIDLATEGNECAGMVILQVCSSESMPQHTHTKENIAVNVVARRSPGISSINTDDEQRAYTWAERRYYNDLNIVSLLRWASSSLCITDNY